MSSLVRNILLFILFLFLAAFFSGSETAFITARRLKLEVWKRLKVKGAIGALRFLERPERFLTTTLVGTNISIVVASSLIAIYLKNYLPGWATTFITAAFFLIFGEIIPKSIARVKANTITIHTYPIHRVFYLLFFPLIQLVETVSSMVLKIFGKKETKVRRFFSREELVLLIQEGERTGVVGGSEKKVISRMILRGRMCVRDIMVPRTEITAISADVSVKQARRLFQQSGFSRLPVIIEDLDHVSGVLYVRDLILEQPARLQDIIRPLQVVPESLNVLALLHNLRQEAVTMALVVDEYGGTAGLVTLEDVFEEFLGDIQDEHDEEAALVGAVTATRLDVQSRISIHDLNERFGLSLPLGDYATLGGFINDRLGHIPSRGETFTEGKYTIRVLSSQKTRAGWVRIVRPAAEVTRKAAAGRKN